MWRKRRQSGQKFFGRERPRFVGLASRHKPTPFLPSLRGSLPPLDDMKFTMPSTSDLDHS
jgi:hypothetical protein